MEGGERAPVLTEASCLIIASSIVGPVDHQEALASVMDLGHGVPPVVGIGHHLRLSDERAAVPRQPQHPARTVAKIRGGGDNHHGPTAWAPPRLEVGGARGPGPARAAPPVAHHTGPTERRHRTPGSATVTDHRLSRGTRWTTKLRNEPTQRRGYAIPQPARPSWPKTCEPLQEGALVAWAGSARCATSLPRGPPDLSQRPLDRGRTTEDYPLSGGTG